MPSLPDLAAASSYAQVRLAAELSPALPYHCVAHTATDVLPAAERIAGAEGVTGRMLVLLLTGVWFHDLGFVVRAEGHELIGAGFAQDVLPSFGYDDQDLEIVRGLIVATTVPQRPATVVEEILCDADLDVLGRPDFIERNDALRAELAAAGQSTTAATWYLTQAEFVRDHRYFTGSARRARDAGKAANLEELERRAASAAAQAR